LNVAIGQGKENNVNHWQDGGGTRSDIFQGKNRVSDIESQTKINDQIKTVQHELRLSFSKLQETEKSQEHGKKKEYC
jgi:hypothetical protein